MLNNRGLLRDITERGNEKARKVAQETMDLVRDSMGIGRF